MPHLPGCAGDPCTCRPPGTDHAAAHRTEVLDAHLERKRRAVRALVAEAERLGAAARHLAAPPVGATAGERHRAVADAVAREQRLRASYRATWAAALREGWTPRELASMDLSVPLPPRHRC